MNKNTNKNKIWKFFETRPIVAPILFTGIFLVLWLLLIDKEIANLFVNLGASFLASALTIGIIDRLYKKKDEVEKLPLRQAIYRDIQLFVSRTISLWSQIYESSTVERDNIKVSELFSKRVMEGLFCGLDLEGKPNVLPEMDWIDYISGEINENQKIAERILDRYATLASPEVVQLVHFMAYDCNITARLSKNMPIVKRLDASEQIPRPAVLSSYAIIPNDEDCDNFNKLVKRCHREHAYLLGKGFRMPKVAERITIINKHIPPSSVMTGEKLAAQNQAFREWQKSHTKI